MAIRLFGGCVLVCALFLAACSGKTSHETDENGGADFDWGIGGGDDDRDTTEAGLPDIGGEQIMPDDQTVLPDDDGDIIGDRDPDDGGKDDVSDEFPDTTDTGGMSDEEAEIEWPDSDSTEVICVPNEEEVCPYSGPAGTENVGPCKAGKRKCSPDGTQWSQCYGEILPEPDVCTDIVDNNCDDIVNNGYSDGAEGCVCLPYEEAPCYTGPAGTEGVGECKGGKAVCSQYGNGWGPCLGQVLPVPETGALCSNNKNDDCVGGVDDGLDADGDGWTVCQNDCCDNASQCQNPALVNLGAVEVEGDGIDNDCNGQIDEKPVPCSTTQKFSGITAIDLLKAMGICKIAQNGSWGIVGTPTLTRADGQAILCSDYATCSAGLLNQGSSAVDIQTAVMSQFGTDPSNAAIEGTTMASLSSGRARDNHNDPDPTTTVTYRYDFGQPPADFVAPHGGTLPKTSPSCPASTGSNPSNDSVMLTVQLKVPTNAHSFSFNFRFFSQEYYHYTCQYYNDFFVVLLDTSWMPGPGEQPIPADKNIAFDSNGSYISVNSTNFFTVCVPKTGYSCPDGTSALAGTGYDPANAGATKWLATSAPVVPGETIMLRFVIWDTSDTSLDSLVLIDNFKWSAEGTSGPVTFECWDLNQNSICDVATEDQSGDGICNERDC